jgi:hypothetical protein
MITLNTNNASKANIKFSQEEKLPFLGTIKVDFLLETIIFYIIKVFTPFLLYL